MSDDLAHVVGESIRALREIADVLAEVLNAAETRMALYSQRDPLWWDVRYNGGRTIGEAGCYLTCVAMMVSLTGSAADTPDVVAARLREASVFEGDELAHPGRIPIAYPALRWGGRLDWRNKPANLDWLGEQMEAGPVIIEVEFRPGGAEPPVDQHFVVAERFVGDDLQIVDPWDGSRTRLLARYALAHWDLERAIYGARLLRVK